MAKGSRVHGNLALGAGSGVRGCVLWANPITVHLPGGGMCALSSLDCMSGV